MAETTKHQWTSTIKWVIGLIFICGMTFQTVKSMDIRVTTNTNDIKTVKEDVHSNEILVREFIGMLKETKEDTGEIRQDFKEFKQYLMQYDFKTKEQ